MALRPLRSTGGSLLQFHAFLCLRAPCVTAVPPSLLWWWQGGGCPCSVLLLCPSIWYLCEAPWAFHASPAPEQGVIWRIRTARNLPAPQPFRSMVIHRNIANMLFWREPLLPHTMKLIREVKTGQWWSGVVAVPSTSHRLALSPRNHLLPAWFHSPGIVLPSADLLPCCAADVEEAKVSSAFCIRAGTVQEGRPGWLCPPGFGRDHAEKPWWYLFWNSFCSGEQLLFQGKQGEDLQILESAVKRPAQAWGSAGYFWRLMSPTRRDLELWVILGPC